jgi:cytochrome o ubiquinol oxidase subunit 2
MAPYDYLSSRRGPVRARIKALQRILKPVQAATFLAAIFVLDGCSALRQGFLNPVGPVAGGERHLFVILGVVLVFVAGPVLILTPLFAWRYRLGGGRDVPFKPKWSFNWPLEGFIWLPPIAIVIGLAFLLWPDTHKLDPYAPVGGAGPPLRVQVVAMDWKWLFIYPDEHIATVNELDVPAGRPVHLDLTSATVMQSLLLPQLAGQIYAMAGMSTQLNFRADRPGVFEGENTQYNGKGFQDDRFKVVARSAQAFEAWAQGVRRSAPAFDEAYSAVMARSVQPVPQLFSAPPPGLYMHIVQATRGASPTRPKGRS